MHRALALLAGVLLVPCARGQDVRKEISKSMEQLAGKLKTFGERQLAIGQITGPANFPSNSGPGLGILLAAELERHGIAVKPRAKLGLHGQYLLANLDHPDFFPKKRLGIALTLKVEDAFGKVFKDCKDIVCTFPGEDAVIELMAPPVVLPARETPLMRDRLLRKSLEEPRTAIVRTKIQATPESPFAIEILVDGKALDPADDEGLAFLKLQPQKQFQIRLINRADHEVGVRLAIDGISVFAFSKELTVSGPLKGQPRHSVFLVPPQEELVIPGWYVSSKEWTPFMAGSYPKGSADLGQSSASLGVITATFAAAWNPQEAQPAHEADSSRLGIGVEPSSAVGTNLGAVPRKVGVVRAVVSARFKKD